MERALPYVIVICEQLWDCSILYIKEFDPGLFSHKKEVSCLVPLGSYVIHSAEVKSFHDDGFDVNYCKS